MVCVMAIGVAACAGTTDETVRSPAEGAAPSDTSSALVLEPTAPTVETEMAESEAIEAQEVAVTTILSADECTFRCPMVGDVFAVAGVNFDVGQPMRDAPDEAAAIVATLPSISTVVTTGDNRMFWSEVNADGSTGWVERGHLYATARTVDITTNVVAALGAPPVATSMLELGLTVANTRVVSFDAVTSTVTVAKAPTEGATGEVTYDVIGFPDDSVSGERLVITGQQIDDSTLPATGFARAVVYELVSVIATDICARGAGVDLELCV